MFRLILLRVLESYFHHRWLYVIPVVLMTVMSGVYLFLKEPAYLAEGVIYVQKESLLAQLTSVRDVGYSYNTPAQDTATELMDLMRTDAFIRAIIQKTNLESKMSENTATVNDTIDGVRKAVWATPLGNNQILVVASYDDPMLSYQLVSATIDNYKQWKINSDRVESQTALTFFEGLLATYKVDLESARQELEDYLQLNPAPVRGDRPELQGMEIARLQSELQQANSRYAKAFDNVESSRLALAQVESNSSQTYILIDSPTIPTEPELSLKTTAIEVGVFVMVGVVLSVIGIGGNALLDRSFRFPVDVHNLVKLSVLASIPDVTSSRKLTRRQKKEVANKNAKQKLLEQPVSMTLSPNGHQQTMPEVYPTDEEIIPLEKEIERS